MPKILENIREQILEEAKKQVAENGYGKVTIRSVAKACGIGVGTVYNYFPSKDMLVASFMVEDWNRFLGQIEEASTKQAPVFFEKIVNCLANFMEKYQALFGDPDAVKVYAAVFSVRHKQLREQLANKIKPVCENACVDDKEFLAEWIAESLLTWTVAGKSFEKQYKIIERLI